MKPQEVAERALALSRTDGCIVLVHDSTNANLRWADNTLTTNGVASSQDITVIAVDGARAGSISRSRVTPDSLEDVVRAAERAAADSEPAEDASPLVHQEAAGDAGAWQQESAETSIHVFDGFAPALGNAFEAARGAGHGLYGYAEQDLTTLYLASSTGLRLRHEQSDGRFEMTGRTPEGARSAWTGQGTRDFGDIDVEQHAGELARRLEWARRRVELGAGRYETLLPPSAVADFAVYMYWSMGARDAHEGRTAFSRPGGTKVGEQLTDLPLRLYSDPSMPRQQCAPFVSTAASTRLASAFDNGLALPATDWIRDGQLQALLQTRHSARLTGQPVTPWIDNLAMEVPGAAPSLDEMVAATDRGLLLTCLWYIRMVDPQTLLVTGLTRDGVFLVEGGEVTGVVTNFRFNESPLRLLHRATEVGRAEPTLPREFGDYFTTTTMPPLRVPDFNMSSVSLAS